MTNPYTTFDNSSKIFPVRFWYVLFNQARQVLFDGD